jgi:glutamine synthetase
MENLRELTERLRAAGGDVEFAESVRACGADAVDLRFTDLPGRWHHVTVPAARLDAGLLAGGVGFDGSSVSGFKRVERGDMVLLPDRATAQVEEWSGRIVVALLSMAAEAQSRTPFPLDPRLTAIRAERALMESGHADVSIWSPELEFYVFSSVAYDERRDGSFFSVSSDEAGWIEQDGCGAELGYRIRTGAGYHASPPCDRHFEFRNEVVARMQDAGIPVKYHHHENGAPGQLEIELLGESLVQAADHVMLAKHIIRNTALESDLAATFMPKPLVGEAGSGFHVHVKLMRGGRPLFHAEDGYAGLSEQALHFIGGILSHGRALSAIVSPSTNSYRRLRPGYEAPTNLFFSAGNRSAAIRIPRYATQPESKTIEYRPPDATANPYLMTAALLAAGIDGMERKTDPKARGFGPFDRNVHELPRRERDRIVPLPATVEEALVELEEDSEFLTVGGIFTADFVETWLDLKREEIEAIASHPHPGEYSLYFDC